MSNWDQFLVTDEQREEQKRVEIENSTTEAFDSIPVKPLTQNEEVECEQEN